MLLQGTRTMAYQSFCSNFLPCLVILVTMKSASLSAQAQSNKPFLISLGRLCNITTYPNTCYSTLAPLINATHEYDWRILYNLSVKVAKTELLTASKHFVDKGAVSQMFNKFEGKRVQLAMKSCHGLLDLAMYHLNLTIPRNGIHDLSKVETRENFRTWLTGVGALFQTCKDEFNFTPFVLQKLVIKVLEQLSRTVSNSLAIMYEIGIHLRGSTKDDHLLHSEKDSSSKHISAWPPTGLSVEDKMLFENSKLQKKPNVVVAADGSGNYKTISAALNDVPPNSNQRFVIYVKEGVYKENVVVAKEKWNVLMYGDGMYKTVVTSNRSNTSGTPTFQSATFAVMGKGFIAQDMKFQNSAGLSGGQAVALLSAADQSIFYRCCMDGYQDTLFAHTMVQFYRECRIYGTVDVIFGYAAAVFQKCTIYAKKPMQGQPNVLTAQGKQQAGSKSGISIQQTQFSAAEDLKGVATFLGRPWHDYATTVVMESYLDRLIDLKGWLAFTGVPVPPSTIYFAEYMNQGPGSDTSNRADWPGVKRNISSAEASKFTVRSFIRGDGWLPETGVLFQTDL